MTSPDAVVVVLVGKVDPPCIVIRLYVPCRACVVLKTTFRGFPLGIAGDLHDVDVPVVGGGVGQPVEVHDVAVITGFHDHMVRLVRPTDNGGRSPS